GGGRAILAGQAEHALAGIMAMTAMTAVVIGPFDPHFAEHAEDFFALFALETRQMLAGETDNAGPLVALFSAPKERSEWLWPQSDGRGHAPRTRFGPRGLDLSWRPAAGGCAAV